MGMSTGRLCSPVVRRPWNQIMEHSRTSSGPRPNKLFNLNKAEFFEGRFFWGGQFEPPPIPPFFYISRRTNLISI